LEKVEKQAKELGISPNDIKGYPDLKKVLNSAETKSDQLKDSLDKVKSLKLGISINY